MDEIIKIAAIGYGAIVLTATLIISVIAAAWGIWSKGYRQGYDEGIKTKINAGGRTIYEPYKENLEPPR